MAQLVFTKEYYDFNAFLNPTSAKIGSSCLRKSIFVNEGRGSHYRNLSLDGGGRSSRYERNPEEGLQSIVKDSPTFTSSIFKKKKGEADHNLTAPSIEIQKIDASYDRLQQLNQRNQQLQNQLKNQSIKFQNLRAKCEELEGKLQIYTNRSQLNSSFSSMHSHNPPSRTSHREQLQAIRQRLRAINFSKIYQMINQPQKK